MQAVTLYNVIDDMYKYYNKNLVNVYIVNGIYVQISWFFFCCFFLYVRQSNTMLQLEAWEHCNELVK